MKPPPSAHPAANAEAGARFAAETIEGFRQLDVDTVVIGGWAVCLYGSPVFSIDLDVLIPEREWDRWDVHDFIEARTDRHKSVYADSYLEVSGVEWPSRLWVLGDSFRPDRVIDRFGTQSREVESHGQTIVATVPAAAVLAFMKTKAACNRANKLHALRRPRRLAGLDASDRAIIEGAKEPFFVRKVAKDLVDIGFLASHHTNYDAVVDVAATTDIVRPLQELLSRITPDVRDETARIAAEFGLEVSGHDVVASLRKAFDRV